MRTITYLLFLLILANICAAQNGDSIRIITLKAKVTDVDGFITRAYIHSVSDTGMFLMLNENPVFTKVNPRSMIQMKPKKIKVVSVRRKNQVIRGLALGALSGAVLGTVIGLTSYESSDKGGFDLGPGLDAAAGFMVGGAVGGVVGLSFSIGSRRYKINGKESNYRKMENNIHRRLLKKSVRSE